MKQLGTLLKITLLISAVSSVFVGVEAANWFSPPSSSPSLSNGPPSQMMEKNDTQSTTMFLLENSGAFISILKELFTEIDWPTIIRAQVEIEKFISKVERLVSIIRGREARDGRTSATSNLFTGRWWAATAANVKPLSELDTTTTKAALEKFACAVGYMKLLDFGNEALDELDASKRLSGLFSASMKNSTSWFG